jgi:hypothetical protein
MLMIWTKVHQWLFSSSCLPRKSKKNKIPAMKLTYEIGEVIWK